MDKLPKVSGWLFPSLHGYTLARLPSDALAALILTAIALPGQLATARLMGLPPSVGLYAFAAGSLAFAMFGANRFASVAADSTIAPIMAGALALIVVPGTERYADLATVVAVLVGIILLVAGLLKAGWIADLLSVPVTVGFLAGIAVHIIVSQLPSMLGVPAPPQEHVLARLLAILQELPQAKLFPVLIGFGVLACTMISEWISPRIPGPLIGILASGLAVWWLKLDQHGLAVLGSLPIALPSASLIVPSWSEFVELAPLAMTVALVCMVQTAAVVRSYPSDPAQPENVSRDFAAVGVGSIVAGATGSFAVDASPPSTAAVAESGGTSQVCSLLAVAIIAAIAIFASGAFAFLPEAALGGILVYIGLRIVRVFTMRQIYLRGGVEILFVVASAALVVILPIETGVALSIGLSLLQSLYIVARPDSAVLARVPDTTVWWDAPTGGEHEPGVVVFAPGAPINFTNAYFIRSRLMAAIAAAREPVRMVVIEANGVIFFDFTGSQILQEAISELRAQGVKVALARLESERAASAAQRTGLIDAIGASHVFHSVEEAIQANKSKAG